MLFILASWCGHEIINLIYIGIDWDDGGEEIFVV
jgi:hypothetical protein